MNKDTEEIDRGFAEEEVRPIAHWARRYAQNRTGPILLGIVVFSLFFFAFGGLGLWAGQAWRARQWISLGICLCLLGLVLVALVWFAVPKWGGRWIEKTGLRPYAKEGHVRLNPTVSASRRRLVLAAGLIFAMCVPISVVLGLVGLIPSAWMQPVSALYFVPFLVVLGLSTREVAGPLVFLWPCLYALHALLLLAGAPILFTGAWEPLNMVLPVAGYGLVSALVGHFYNRFALRKLKELARQGASGAPEGERG